MHVLYDSVHVVLESSIVLFSLANPLYLLTSFPPPQYVSNCGARIVLYHKVFDKNIKQYWTTTVFLDCPHWPLLSVAGSKAQAQSWVLKSLGSSCLLWHCRTCRGCRHTGSWNKSVNVPVKDQSKAITMQIHQRQGCVSITKETTTEILLLAFVICLFHCSISNAGSENNRRLTPQRRFW